MKFCKNIISPLQERSGHAALVKVKNQKTFLWRNIEIISKNCGFEIHAQNRCNFDTIECNADAPLLPRKNSFNNRARYFSNILMDISCNFFKAE